MSAAKLLTRARYDAGLSQGELAKRMGTSRPSEGADPGPDLSAARELDELAEMTSGVHGGADQPHVGEIEAT